MFFRFLKQYSYITVKFLPLTGAHCQRCYLYGYCRSFLF